VLAAILIILAVVALAFVGGVWLLARFVEKTTEGDE
jgi:hypothetical protein